MGWLVGTVVGLAIFYPMVVSPRFRYLAISLLILAAIGIFFTVVNADKESEAYRQQQSEARRVRVGQHPEGERWATMAIRADELSVSNVSVVKFFQAPLKRETWWRWRLKGIIANNSKSALRSISFLLTLKDCPPNQQCKIIGKKTAATRTDDSVLVPAGQVGLFQTDEMQFKNMPPSSNLQWEYKITEIRATRHSDNPF
jgi:hypothetical protein